MKKVLTDAEVEKIVLILNDSSSIMHDMTVKIPAKIRQALRINFKTLFELAKEIEGTRSDIIQRYIDAGDATKDATKGTIHFDRNINLVTRELEELSKIENSVELVGINSKELNAFLESVDISMEEEDAILTFEQKEEKKDSENV